MVTSQDTNGHGVAIRGQTLIEVIVAIGILIGGIIAVITLSFASLRADQVSSRKIVAMNLARESLEVIRNMRDSNWLAGKRDDCSGTPSDYNDDWLSDILPNPNECGFNPQNITTVFTPLTNTWITHNQTPGQEKIFFTPEHLYIQPDPGGATETGYKRHVTLTPKDATQPGGACVQTGPPGNPKCSRITHYELLADVEYSLGSRTYHAQIATILYNWKP